MKPKKKGLKLAKLGSWGLRSHLCHIDVQDEAASANIEAKVSYPDIDKTINKVDCIKQQFFKLFFNKTVLFWKQMPLTNAFDKVTLLLGANTAGDFKLNPKLIYHFPKF